jgi:hypothetical protein
VLAAVLELMPPAPEELLVAPVLELMPPAPEELLVSPVLELMPPPPEELLVSPVLELVLAPFVPPVPLEPELVLDVVPLDPPWPPIPAPLDEPGPDDEEDGDESELLPPHAAMLADQTRAKDAKETSLTVFMRHPRGRESDAGSMISGYSSTGKPLPRKSKNLNISNT